MLLQQVSHGAIQFTAYEELRKVIFDYKSKGSKRNYKTSDADPLVCIPIYVHLNFGSTS